MFWFVLGGALGWLQVRRRMVRFPDWFDSSVEGAIIGISSGVIAYGSIFWSAARFLESPF
jgi:hypothetical protein